MVQCHHSAALPSPPHVLFINMLCKSQPIYICRGYRDAVGMFMCVPVRTNLIANVFHVAALYSVGRG